MNLELQLEDLEDVDGLIFLKNGVKMNHYPSSVKQFEGVEVEYITLPGWKASISDIRNFEDLPQNCRHYILIVEAMLGLPIYWVGVGPSRDAMIFRNDISFLWKNK